MFEFRVAELRKGDEFTADNGWSWWKVQSAKRGEVACSCISSQNPAHRPGDSDSFLFLCDDRVIVR